MKINEFDDKLCYEINDAKFRILNLDLENPWLKSCDISLCLGPNKDTELSVFLPASVSSPPTQNVKLICCIGK